MKKVILAFAAVALLFTACKKTPDPVTVALSKTSDSGATLVNSSRDMMVSITNNTSESAEINWERNGTSEPTGWSYSVNSSSANSGTVTVAAGQTVDITLTINPNGNSGTGEGTIVFYDANHKDATTQTYTYSLSTVASYFALSPQGSMTGADRVTNDKDYHIWVINNNTVPVDVQWRTIRTNGTPSAWVYAICTDLTCYAPEIVTETMTIAPSDSVDFKGTISPNTELGTGGYDALFFVAADSANSVEIQTISHSATP